MAARRMFSREILESDAFLSLSFEAQCLYVQMSLSADDSGFSASPRRICRIGGIDESCIDELVNAGFIFRFDSGVVVILDWYRCNSIKPDRFKPTIFQSELSQLELDKTMRYTVLET